MIRTHRESLGAEMSTTRTIAVTGVTENDAARFAMLLERHQHKLDLSWQNADAADADLLLIDIESTYGQMDWLRARSRGRLVIAYTSAIVPIEPEFSLRKPVVSGDLIALLNRIGAGLEGKPAASIIMQPANAPTYEQPPVPAEEPIVAATPPATVARAEPARSTAPAHPRTFFIDELLGALSATAAPVRLVAEGLPSIIADPSHQRWHAGVGLKALTGWCRKPLTIEQLVSLDAEEFTNAIEILPGQPYSRLIWFARLTRSEGNLDPALSPDARYRLNRWPQVEREFPKHFRIATAMMRGTGTLDEIAAQSCAGIADVADFISAYHAIGYVECDSTPAMPMADRSGLLDRMRKSLRN
jgi:hypothetical protein